ncbi:MAG: hypothetical protein AAFX06_01995 [Planctomycetota bacterium]
MLRLSVAARLNLMCVTVCLSGVLGIVGAWEITKGAEMHQLNFLHIKYNHKFNEEVARFREGATFESENRIGCP